MQQWFHIEGERHLLEAESVSNSGEQMEQILNSFTGFLIEANVSVFSRHVSMCLYLPACLNLSPPAGPKAPCHDVGVGGRATPAERLPVHRDGGLRGSSQHLQVGPGELSGQGGGLWQGASDHGQRV